MIPPAAQALPPHPDLPTLRENLAAVETMISHELTLIGSRMSWFAISESFLFGAYATVATDPNRLKELFVSAAGAGTQPPIAQATIGFLLLALPIGGMCFAMAAWFSVLAATLVLRTLNQCRGNLLLQINEQLEPAGYPPLPVMGTAHQRALFARRRGIWGFGSTSLLGQAPQHILPWMMTAMWVVALLVYGRFGMAR